MLVAEKVVLNVLRLPVEGDGTNVDTVCKSKGSDQGDDRTRRTQLLTTPDLTLGVSTHMYRMELGKFQRRSEGDILLVCFNGCEIHPQLAIW